MTHNINTVVLIDDDYISNYLTKRLLSKSGICQNILTASNGSEGIKVLEELSHDDLVQSQDSIVILLDINMPVMDGWQFLEKYNEFFSKFKCKIEVYILSSSINPDDIQKARSYQVVKDFLNKPVNVEKLYHSA